MSAPKAKRQPFGLTMQLSSDKKSLLITADLTRTPVPSKNGKKLAFASTQMPQSFSHPAIPSLYVNVAVVQRKSNEPPEVLLLREQQRAIKAKLRAYNDQRKAAKAAKAKK